MTAAAWADYRSALRFHMIKAGVDDSRQLELELRKSLLIEAFAMVKERLPEKSRLREGLENRASKALAILASDETTMASGGASPAHVRFVK